MKTAMVIASNRPDRFAAWCTTWAGDKFPWDVTILVQDGGGPPFDLGRFTRLVEHHTWHSIGRANHSDDGSAGALPGWLSRCDSGIKSHGFLLAVRDHKADIVLVLDDDCLPSPLDAGGDPANFDALCRARRQFVERHLAPFRHTPAWTTTVAGFEPRGLPYDSVRPEAPGASRGEIGIQLNMGLWEHVPDRDSVHSLVDLRNPGDWRPPPDAYAGHRVMPSAQYWPMSGMNLAFHKYVAPLMYFPRMGEGVPFRRFDDIWCGVVAQRCMRHLGLHATVGGPVVRHDRASDPFDCLVAEARGIRANEEFWRVVDGIDLDGCPTPLACALRVGETLRDGDHPYRPGDEVLADYLPKLGGYYMGWVQQFEEAGW